MYVYRCDAAACPVIKDPDGLEVEPQTLDGYWLISQSFLLKIRDELKDCEDAQRIEAEIADLN